MRLQQPTRRAFLTLSGTAAVGLAVDRRLISFAAEPADQDVLVPPVPDPAYECTHADLIEITRPGPIVQPDGTTPCAWSRRPYLDLNFEDANFLPIRSVQRLRMKKWDMYHIVTPEHQINFLVAWVGYTAFFAAHIYTRKTREFVEGFHLRAADPETPMMRNSTAGRTEFACKIVTASFEVDGEYRRIRVDWPNFAKTGLAVKIDLHQPAGHESICASHAVNPKRSYYSHKINCMTAAGEVRLGTETIRLRPEDCFGMLDFGRGYYPDRTFWYWSTASGRDEDGKLVGWNLGHGNDPKNAAENAVFHDGRLHKIGPVRCTVPKRDEMRPWRVMSEDNRVDLTLTPEKVRVTDTRIGPLHTIGRPAFGLYNGYVTLDSGKTVKIRNLFGQYEWFDQSW